MKFGRPLEIRGTSDNFIPFYKSLDPHSKLYRSVTDAIELLKCDPTRGNHVGHDKIPTYYVRKYRIKTLFRIELIDYWRLMYAIHAFDDIGIGVLILEALDHKRYNERFGYSA
jgi:hypothetical protein